MTSPGIAGARGAATAGRSLAASVVLAALVLCASNALKPLVVDDPAFVAVARQIAAHPADPYGFEIFWYQKPQPASEVLAPPESETWNITGRILFEPRVSIVGALVLAYPGKPTDKKAAFSNLMGNLAQIDPSNAPDEVFMRVTGEPLARAEVQMDGSFTLAKIRQRHVRLAVEHDFYGLKQVEPVHIPAGETEVEVGALATYLGAHVIGQLVGPGRQGNAVVHIAAEPDPMAAMRDLDGYLSMVTSIGNLNTHTDGEGRFEFRAMWPSPQVRLMLRNEEHCGRTEVFSLAPGERRELLLGTQPAINVRAVVVNQDDEPVENARVSVVPEDIKGNISRRVSRSSGRTGEGCTLTGIGSDADFVEQHQRMLIRRVHDSRQVHHVGREGGEALPDVLAIADVGEEIVHQGDTTTVGGGNVQSGAHE